MTTKSGSRLGRPPLDGDSRAAALGFTVTQDDKDIFLANVDRSGTKQSEFFRQMIRTHLTTDSEKVSRYLPRALVEKIEAQGDTVESFLEKAIQGNG